MSMGARLTTLGAAALVASRSNPGARPVTSTRSSGAKPGDLAIEQASKLETIVNVSTAKSLGLVLSPSLLTRVDEVVG